MDSYTDFHFSPSEIGKLFGCFGPLAMLHAVIKIWKKSSLKSSVPAEFLNDGFRDEQKGHLMHLGVEDDWTALLNDIRTCRTQDHIRNIEQRAFDLLYHSPVIENVRTQIIPLLLPEEQCMLSQELHRSENCHDTFRFLHDKYLQHPTCEPLLQAFVLSSSLWMHASKRSAMTYGRLGESKVRELYNKCHALPIESCGREVKRVMPNLGALSWSVQGFIDGMSAGKLIEIKHRTGKFPSELPDHEQLQMQVYLYLLGQQEGTVLQCVQTNDGVYIEQKPVLFSQKTWESIQTKLFACMRFIHMLHQQSFARDCFCQLSNVQRAKMLQKYL